MFQCEPRVMASSQTSFLETVVGWSDEQCRQNLADALPKLIVSFCYSCATEILAEGVLVVISIR
jgi:hypothetical protein